MAKIRVYAHGANPSADRPLHFTSKKIAHELVSNRRANPISPIAIELVAISVEVSKEIVAAAGYDQAVNRTPQKNFNDVWEKRSSAGFQILQMYPPWKMRGIDEIVPRGTEAYAR